MNTEGTFNKEEFGFLLEKAKGDRSINQYAIDSGVSAAHISRFLRQLIDTPPSPETIAKLTSHTQNNISYKDLMVAAGHIIEQSNLIIIDEAHSSENNAVNEQIETYSPMDLRERRMELERKFFQVILSNLYTASFKWGINNSEERTHFPDMTIDIDHDGYTKWYLEFKGSLDERRGLAFHPYHIFGQISMIDFKPTDKFTLATNSEIDFNRALRIPPKSLRANLYIMLIDLNRGIIIREEKICDYND